MTVFVASCHPLPSPLSGAVAITWFAYTSMFVAPPSPSGFLRTGVSVTVTSSVNGSESVIDISTG